MDQLTRSPAANIRNLVLVVDDEPSLRDLLSATLTRAGYSPHAVADGGAAVAYFRRFSERVAAVLLDVQMPGMDGPQTLAALQEIDPRVPCVFIASDPAPHTIGGLLALGVEGVLSKPFRSSDLITALATTGVSRPRVANGTAPEPAKGLRILIVEDDADTASSLAELLELYGHAVVVADTGRTAIRLADSFAPDVVLLDILLPDINGYEVARQLLGAANAGTNGKPPLLIAVTGCGELSDLGQSQAAGIDLHLVKPVPPARLLSILNRFARVVS